MRHFIQQMLCRAACLCLPLSLSAQVLRGSITDEKGEPVPAATVYLHELKLGTAADESGEFQLNVKRGAYTYQIQCIGFQTVKGVVEVSEKGARLNIRMSARTYTLPTVFVSKDGEDPAYRIMRYAIAMAPYYSHQVSGYTADVYLKGTAKVNKISRLVKAVAKKELRGAQVKEGEAYFLESMNEIAFTAPNTYKHRVLSANSTLPADLGGSFNTMNYVNVNIYSLNLLARDALSSYRFAYEGFVEQNDLYICKLKVTPRRSAPGLMSGYLYIVEGTWQVYSADLHGEVPFGAFRGVMNTNEVQKGVRLPTSYSLSAKVNALGNEATFDYAGTVRYKEVKVDETLANPLGARGTATAAAAAPAPPKPAAQGSKKESKKDSLRQERRRKELMDLLEKDNLSRREMVKASKLITEEAEERQPQSLNLTSAYQVQIDSGVRSRDTSYWSAIRPIPLKRDEAVSFRKTDSIRAIAEAPTDSAAHGGELAGSLLFGKRYRPSPTLRLTHSGLIAPRLLYFNAVDGWKYGQELAVRKMLPDSATLYLRGEAWWAFSRRAFMWKLAGSYSYLPERRASVFFDVGKYNQDFSEHNPETHINSLCALLLHNSYNRLYESFTVQVGNSIDIANGLALHTSLAYHDRSKLHNSARFSLFGRNAPYAPNLPENAHVQPDYALRTAAIATVSLSYTPRYFYRMRGRQKRMVRSDYPTFSLTWREGIPALFGSKIDFSFAKVAVRQTIPMGLLEEAFYQVEAAKFFRSSAVDFPDFHHFAMPGYGLYTHNDSTWMYSRYYRHSTPAWGASARVRYTTPFLALKYLPLFNRTYCRENLKAQALYTPQGGLHTELGYEVSEVFLMLRVGLFVGFENAAFRLIGMNISLDL
jgi:predicted DNA-binding ribbon-helix-helix protein